MRRKAAAALAVAAATALWGCATETGSSRARDDRGHGRAVAVRASLDGWRWAPREEAPTNRRSAGGEPAPDPVRTTTTTAATAPAAPAPPQPPPPPTPSSGDDTLARAEVLRNGIALPPLEAPPEVRAIFEAGNTIARTPYKWGGGHGRWRDTGYDCSGSVSYALAAAGLLSGPLASGPLMSWGRAGKGRWVTIYANPGHVFLVVAGVRFDTSAGKRTGSRWTNEMTDTSGYVARHPAGL